MIVFEKNPFDISLNNHSLQNDYQGYRSMNITSDWRAIYEEIKKDQNDPIAYFFKLGTHKELYSPKEISNNCVRKIDKFVMDVNKPIVLYFVNCSHKK